MMKRIIVALFLVFSFGATMYVPAAHAGTDCDYQVRGISNESVKNATLVACMKAAESEKVVKKDVVDSIMSLDEDSITKMSSLMTTAIGSMARDLNIAVNEFVQTDVGKLAFFTLSYAIFGDDVKAIVGLILILIFSNVAINKTLESIIDCTPYQATNIFGREVTRYKAGSWREMGESQAFWYWAFNVLRIAIVVISIGVTFWG